MGSTDIVLDLALQGGGSHGAFTWGVLDRLLDERRIHCAAISGASAGAMNAVVLASGLLTGGRAGARQSLNNFWKRISQSTRSASSRQPFQALFMRGDHFSRPWPIAGPWAASIAFWTAAAETFTRTISPYQWNPLNYNPLLDLFSEAVDFELLRTTQDLRLFISATSVRTGALKVFRNPELSARAVMASACLPQLFQAVEIDGEAYWDGGYLGNPALLPLIAESEPADLLIIQLNPPARAVRSRSAAGIADRLNEITFNASLMKELKSIALLKQALDEEPPGHAFKHPLFNQIRQLRLHRIAAEEATFRLGAKSKLDPEWEFLLALHGQGQQAADAWLSRHWSDLGQRSTLDLESVA